MKKFLFGLAGAGQVTIAEAVSEKGSLVGGQTFALRGAKGRRVTCNSGVLWVTVEGDREDHLLSASESMVIPGRGRVLLSPLGSASYRLA
ncbi:MAG TPA: DUF2917 domain-containing protein [Spirochaetales bacterium]|nr:DUF2917 domain-containing protein [Spirochaetales bacterium]HRY55281.1 DUF2917 domain-containing protein [Spirochaetia bacterium]HRZ63615.1 DUF2917 domain-containing protein [Spirochaetia bacterium]